METTSVVLPPQLVLAQSTVYASQGSIYALDANNGTLRQQYETQGLVCPAIENDVIYAKVSRHPTYMIQALRVSDGSLLWSYQLEEGGSSSPVVVGSVLYANSSGSTSALHISDGSLIWHYETGPILFASPTVIDGVVYLSPAVNPPSKPFIYALDARKGAFLWRSQIPDSTSYPLTVGDGVIYMSSHSGCFALRVGDGSSIWHSKTRGQPRSSPGVTDEMACITLSEFKQEFSFESRQFRHWQEVFVAALRISDGSVLWQRQLGADTSAANPTAPVVANGMIYVGTDDGYLSALQAGDGALFWRYKTGGTLLSSPVMTNEVIYVGASDGYVYALRVNDGSLLWRTFVSTSVTGSISIHIKERE